MSTFFRQSVHRSFRMLTSQVSTKKNVITHSLPSRSALQTSLYSRKTFYTSFRPWGSIFLDKWQSSSIERQQSHLPFKLFRDETVESLECTCNKFSSLNATEICSKCSLVDARNIGIGLTRNTESKHLTYFKGLGFHRPSRLEYGIQPCSLQVSGIDAQILFPVCALFRFIFDGVDNLLQSWHTDTFFAPYFENLYDGELTFFNLQKSGSYVKNIITIVTNYVYDGFKVISHVDIDNPRVQLVEQFSHIKTYAKTPRSFRAHKVSSESVHLRQIFPLQKILPAYPSTQNEIYMSRMHCFSTAASSAYNEPAALAEDLAAEGDLHHRGTTELFDFQGADCEDWQQQEDQYRETYNHQEGGSAVFQPDVYITVEAFFIAGNVDLKSLSEEPFIDVISGRKHLVIRCEDHPHTPASKQKADAAEDSWSIKRYIVVFQWGSVVLFNFGHSREKEIMDIVKRHCRNIFKEEIRDTYGVLVRPTLDRYSQGGQDKIMVKTLDADGLRIISLILSQSIALDHYTKAIDGMLSSFGELNRTMELTGNFKLHRKKLFQLVAAANSTLSDAILRIGLLERSDVAWQNANYDKIWGYLREDFELDERFESLEKKTDIIRHNVKFYLDILQNRKSDFLEWIIIVLITGEIMVSLYDILHGTGAL